MTDRRALQRSIHAACRDLGFDEDGRRDIQRALTGKDSQRDMTDDELARVVAHLRTVNRAARPKGQFRHPVAPRADLRLVHVLWGKLSRAGKVRVRGRKGLNAFVRARFEKSWGSVPLDIDALRDWEKIDAVIQALMQWCDREGIEVDPIEAGHRR